MTSSVFAPRLAAVLAALSAFAASSFAQTSSPAAQTMRLRPVVVTGNPLGADGLATPATVLNGDALTLKRGSSLGETLNGLPGVSATYFGPNASRPMIRGLDGDRVRMLDNAGASFDASALSFDHAVPIDPLIVDRIEVLRGPAALLYGGGAIGGAVNAINNRIPRERVNGLSGAAELRAGGADSQRAGAMRLEAGHGDYALHVDAFGRRTSDLRVPTFTPMEDGAPLDRTSRVRNSASRYGGGSVGASRLLDRGGYVGLNVDEFDSRYGTPAEAGIHIDMTRRHAGLAGEWKMLGGLIAAVRSQINHTRYEHQEIEKSGEVGTTFRTSGDEWRLEAEHALIGGWRGVIGWQLENADFSALGDEAFVPSTRNRNRALFALEERAWAGGRLTLGARTDRVAVSSQGDAVDAPEPRFGAPAQRRFGLTSASISNLYQLSPQWSLSGVLSYTERAPTAFELFANGVHAATGSYELGDAELQKERGTHVDVAIAWSHGASDWRLGMFTGHFGNFIALDATGRDVDGTVPEYAFRGVRARMSGVELDGRQRLVEHPYRLDVTGKIDVTRGSNLDTGRPLPRIAPWRALIGIDLAQGGWTARMEAEMAARQGRVSPSDVPTAGYTLLNASLMRKLDGNGGDAVWFLKVDNLGDRLAYSASTLRSVRDLSPLPGRSVRTGVRVAF